MDKHSQGGVAHCWYWVKPVHVLAGLLNELHSGNGRVGGMDVCGQECDFVAEVVVPAVDEKTKIDEEIHTNDGDLDVSHHNMPGELCSPKVRLREMHP